MGKANKKLNVSREAVNAKYLTSSLVQHMISTGHKINFDGIKKHVREQNSVNVSSE